MKKIEKRKGITFTLWLLIMIGVVVELILVLLIFAFNEDNDRLIKEREAHTVAVLGAMENTITKESYTNRIERTHEKYSADGPYTIWSFHKLGDEYGQAPHTAKVVGGLIIELDGNPVQETLGPRFVGPNH